MTVEIYSKKMFSTAQKNVQQQLAHFLSQLHAIPVELFEEI